MNEPQGMCPGPAERAQDRAAERAAWLRHAREDARRPRDEDLSDEEDAW
ncbi:hypothetical protein O4J56_01495 [Nocardiopsis sp. RSe5-2]|uniref:Uncharacterized protein n=1 Tax=Nocardiopsis endophytica TaxID=3018445 RepID=A0ABT4TYH1_9ACTN|nr:hypothetical protein [Nocardiopsis endophytica]MDA2809299.1 hypothetical protein [Nocardiopsis endophytica]